VLHDPASDQHEQHEMLQSEQGASGDPTCLFVCPCSTLEPCDLKAKRLINFMSLSLSSPSEISCIMYQQALTELLVT
jgi:hypothetical protein